MVVCLVWAGAAGSAPAVPGWDSGHSHWLSCLQCDDVHSLLEGSWSTATGKPTASFTQDDHFHQLSSCQRSTYNFICVEFVQACPH